jgi:hypothetical protein
MQRGGGQHASRSPTPELETFAHNVRVAQAEARAAAEIRIFRENPKWWLSHVARSRPDYEGWTDIPDSPQERSAAERMVQLIRRLDELDAKRKGDPAVDLPPPPPDPGKE